MRTKIFSFRREGRQAAAADGSGVALAGGPSADAADGRRRPGRFIRAGALAGGALGGVICGAFLSAAQAAKSTASPDPQSAPPAAGCAGLPDHGHLRAALQGIVKLGRDVNTGLGNQEWATVVNRDGVVCAVVFSGPDRGVEWPGSRLISAEKASTANALSGPNFALSTANLYYPAQPGQSLFGLETTAPPNPQAVFVGRPEQFGQPDDPFVGKPIGGIVVFGGGLALYDSHGKIVGGLGVSGDTACADHVIAWKVRHQLRLDAVPVGVAKNATDNMLLDIVNGASVSGYGHPSCKGGKPSDDVINRLADQIPTGPGK
jgi:uncharacterized protein GlcG (DUF336 family)